MVVGAPEGSGGVIVCSPYSYVGEWVRWGRTESDERMERAAGEKIK